jgi:two-component sensor histidine kinase
MSAGRRSRALFPPLERLLRKISLRAQVAILLAVAMLPVGVFAVAQGISTYTSTKKLLSEALTFEAVEAGQNEQTAISEAFGALNALASQIDIDGPVEDCRTVLNTFAVQEKTVPFIGYINEKGKMDCSYPRTELRDFSQQPGFKIFLDSPRRSVTAREKGEVSGKQVIVLNQPVYREGQLRGALSMSLSSGYLNWVARTKDLQPEARFALVTSEGVGVAQSRPATDFEWMPSASQLRRILIGTERILELKSRSGETRVFAIAPLFKSDIFAISSWPGEIIPAAFGWQKLLTVSLPILMWGLAVAVAYFAVDQLALRHILYLDRLVTAYGRSGRALRAQGMRDAPTEIAKLGASFDEMAGEIETRETAMRETLHEKEGLLREVNHRVKNNLQLISSLMSLQIRDAVSEREKVGLERLQERIQGLATVHQKIYESENTSAVRMDKLIDEIARNLLDGSARSRESVTLTTDLDVVTCEPDSAVPLILFATEAIVNTFKHALSHVDKGTLEIALKDDPDALRLRIRNSLHPGAVIAEDQITGRRGIGQQLIEGFARQLRGKVKQSETPDSYTVELVVPKVASGDDGVKAA